MDADPISAKRAVLRIESAEVVASSYRDQLGREQKQFATELKVLSGAEDRDGETFLQWFSFPATGNISPKSKPGQLLTAALGDNRTASTLDELALKLIGKSFAAEIGASKNGEYPRIVHDTIGPDEQMPATAQAANDVDSDEIPWSDEDEEAMHQALG
jgi:hypothetical protein